MNDGSLDPAGQADDIDALAARFRDRSAKIGVIGLGYVGLPLARTIAERGFTVLGFDLDPVKVRRLNAGESYIRHISSESIAALRGAGRLAATGEVARLGEADAILLCVPTPLTRLAPLSYFCTCWKVSPSSRAIASWFMSSSWRRVRIWLPT